MANVYKDIQVSLSPDWVESAYNALTVCYHPEKYGESVPNQRKISKIFEVIRKGHLSIARYISINICLELIPHDTAMQLRTHKFLDCQVTSQRYTGKHLCTGRVKDVVEKYFYFRQPGKYASRDGIYEIDQTYYEFAKMTQSESIYRYRTLIDFGVDEEVARCVLAQGIRQSMAIRTNLQALMDVLSVRTLADSQWEIRQVMDGIIEGLPTVLEPIMTPFLKKHYGKNRDTF